MVGGLVRETPSVPTLSFFFPLWFGPFRFPDEGVLPNHRPDSVIVYGLHKHVQTQTLIMFDVKSTLMYTLCKFFQAGLAFEKKTTIKNQEQPNKNANPPTPTNFLIQIN